MKEQWEKYSYNKWLKNNGRNHLFPDSFMDRMYHFLTPYTQSIQSDKYTGPWDHPDTLKTEIDWELSKQQTRNVLEKLSPDYALIFDDVFSKDKINITKVQAGKGGGSCGWEKITYRADNTLNDVIYLSHEFGHWLAVKKGSPNQTSSINEWQAFFTQHAQYHALAYNKEWSEELKKIAKNHQKQELLQLSSLLPDRLQVLNNLKKGDVSHEDIKSSEKYAIHLHKHTPAAFIALALFEKYQSAIPQTQEKMRKSLFETTEQTSYKSILKDFDLFDSGKLENIMKRALQKIGLPPKQQQSPKPQGFS